MKSIIGITAALFFLSSYSSAQIDANTNDSKDWKNNRDRIIFQFGYAGWLHSDSVLKTEWFSRSASIYFNYDVQFGKSNFSFAPGIGLTSDNVYLNSGISIDDSTNVSSFFLLPNQDAVKSNKISITYIDVPLELRFRTKPDKHDNSWKIAAGLKIGLTAKTLSKLKISEEGENRIYKTTNLQNTMGYHYGPTFRFGYGWFNLFAFYSLTPFFEENKGPEVVPFTIGISINGL